MSASPTTSPRRKARAKYNDRRYPVRHGIVRFEKTIARPRLLWASSTASTNDRMSAGSKEKALSTPPEAFDNVKCFSMNVAPKAVAMTAVR